MARITLPTFRPGRYKDAFGIEFIDGFADVDLTGNPNLLQALAQHHYTIEIIGTPLEDLTVQELRDELTAAGVDFPKGAKKPELIALVEESAQPMEEVQGSSED